MLYGRPKVAPTNKIHAPEKNNHYLCKFEYNVTGVSMMSINNDLNQIELYLESFLRNQGKSLYESYKRRHTLRKTDKDSDLKWVARTLVKRAKTNMKKNIKHI